VASFFMSTVFTQALRAHQAGQAAAAEALYRQAITAGIEVRSARHNLALLLLERRAFAEAKALLVELIASPEADAATHFMVARIFLAEGDPAAALAPLELAHALEPGSIPVRLELARLLAGKAEFPRARALLEEPNGTAAPADRLAALRARAEIEIAWADLEPAEEADHLVAAEQALRAAIAMAPQHPALLNNLTMLLRRQGALAEAETHARRLLAIAPQVPETSLTLAAVLAGRDPAREVEAIDLLRRALDISPDHGSLHYNLAYSLLRLGRFREAWPHYARRFDRQKRTQRPPPGPLWDGRATDKPLLIWGELGFGDVIQVARFLPRAALRAPQLLLACQPALLPLFRNMRAVRGVHDFRAPLPPYGAQLALLDLGLVLGIEAKDLPGTFPYLEAPPDDGRWITIAAAARPRIGIVWVGNRQSGPTRSTTLSWFGALAHRFDLQLFSLQMGPAVAEIAQDGSGRVADLSSLIRDFGDTAAAIAKLDLVITIDTAVAHLAGALGIETWVLLPHRTGWMWHFDQERSRWYPTMRLFRQVGPADWGSVFAQVEPALADWLAQGRGAEPTGRPD
jgi:Flp pilus assembly protein TadD